MLSRPFILFILLAVSISISSIAQDINKTFVKRNAIYLELSSKGPVYALVYDRVFSQKKNNAYSFKAGVSVEKDALSFPLGIGIITGRQKHHAEFSLSVTPYINHYKTFLNGSNFSDKYLYIMPGFGYRYQQPYGGLFFKAIAGPVIFLDPPSDDFWKMNGKVYLGGQAGLGWSF